MSEFLKPDVCIGTWIEVRHTADQGTWIPGDLLGDPETLTPADVFEYTDAIDEGDVEEIRVHRNAIGVRLSAPGYMDATDWSVFETIEEAREELANLLDMGDGTDADGRDVDERAREEIPDDGDRVRVEFVRAYDGEEWEREPVAVFPDLQETPEGLVRTYVHVGQHGAGDLQLLRGSTYYATDDDDEETRKLADELERIGYTFARTRTVWAEGDEPEDGPDDDGGTAPPDEPGPDVEPEPEGPDTPEECRALVDSWIRSAEDVEDRATLGMIRERVRRMEARALMLERAQTSPPDEPPTGGETVCDECERGLGDDYTDGCGECDELREEKRATDAYAELREVRAELGTALGALDDALAELRASNNATVDDAQDRADMLQERVRELETRAVELETVLAEEDREPCERCTEKLAEEGASVCLECVGDDDAETHREALAVGTHAPGAGTVRGPRVPTCSAYDPHAVEDGRCECGPDPCPNALALADEHAEKLKPGTLATFTPTATRDATGLDLQTRRGSRVRIIRPLGEGDADLAETGPMYRVEFDDGARTDAFIDELDVDMEDFIQGLAVLAFGQTIAEGAPVLTVGAALRVLQEAAETVGEDATLVLSLTGSGIEDANVNGLRIVTDDGSRYVEVRVSHPSLPDADGFHTDRYGRRWDFPPDELCPECGQPDSCGDCTHGRLTDAEVLELGGTLQ